MAHSVALDQLIGDSTGLKHVRQRIRQVANSRYNVLISGPSGTGKELVARAIHAQSPRASKPFIPVNCAAFPAGLFSSQLFGHVKGAFTGAASNSLGCFRAADGGTLFLDEIGELDLELQAKLLRALQERKVVPVGSHEGLPVDVRIVVATNRNLEAAVANGTFRLDLFYRLNVVSIETPALVDRRDDIARLAQHFLAKASIENGVPLAQLSPAALVLLEQYEWPGNIRELENLIERAIVFAEPGPSNDPVVLGPECFPQVMEAVALRAREIASAANALAVNGSSPDGASSKSSEEAETAGGPLGEDGHLGEDGQSIEDDALATVRFPSAMIRDVVEPGVDGAEMNSPYGDSSGDAPLRAAAGDWLTLAEVERDHLHRTLKRTGFNQTAAARLLGIDRKLLARKIRKYGLNLARSAY